MVAPTTEKFEELVIQVETSTPGTYENICGMTDATITRSANTDSVEVPADCADESLPLSTQRSVRSLDFTVSGTGVWAAQSHGTLMDWFYSSATKNIRIQNVNAESGDTEFESGPALITNLSNERTKGQKVTATFELQFDGTPTRTAKA